MENKRKYVATEDSLDFSETVANALGIPFDKNQTKANAYTTKIYLWFFLKKHATAGLIILPQVILLPLPIKKKTYRTLISINSGQCFFWTQIS